MVTTTTGRVRLAYWCAKVRTALLVVTVAVCSGCPTRSSVPEAPPDQACQYRLEALGKAIAKYRARSGRLPPSVLESNGFAHSWRALIATDCLEAMDGRRDFSYRFEESWDSPHNRKQFVNWLAGRYTCQSESDRLDYPFTSYLMLVRSGGTSDRTGPTGADLPPDAVLIVESARCGIEVGEPKDLDWDVLWESGSPFGKGKLYSLHPRVVKALRVDGKVIDIPKNLGRDELRRLLNGSAD